jgi:hypothetical protein
LILLFMIVHFTCVLYFNSQVTSLNYLIEFVSQKSTVTWSANFTLGEIATARSASGQAWPTKRPSNWSWGKRGNFSQPINERGTPKARLDSKRRSKKSFWAKVQCHPTYRRLTVNFDFLYFFRASSILSWFRFNSRS